MESFSSPLKTGLTARKVYGKRDDARADVFDYIERFPAQPLAKGPAIALAAAVAGDTVADAFDRAGLP